MNIYLSSFFRAKQLPQGVIPCSAAVYQPKGYTFPKIDWTDIRRDGAWLRPRDFLGEQEPLKAYRSSLYAVYMSRLDEAIAWRDSTLHDCALCCWCPYDRAAKRQLEQWGSFVCHTAVLSEFIYKELKVPVWEDGDRRHMAVLEQNVTPNGTSIPLDPSHPNFVGSKPEEGP